MASAAGSIDEGIAALFTRQDLDDIELGLSGLFTIEYLARWWVKKFSIVSTGWGGAEVVRSAVGQSVFTRGSA